jgi:four helix bundle protein
MIKALADLNVFTISFDLAAKIFKEAARFPKEEKYSLTDQVIRSSRSISANIAEGWGKRIYENEFKKHLVYAMGSLEETKAWLLFAKECGYLTEATFTELTKSFDQLGAKMYTLYNSWKSF